MKILLTPEESTGESLPDPDKFADPHQSPCDKLAGTEGLPEVDSVVERDGEGDQNMVPSAKTNPPPLGQGPAQPPTLPSGMIQPLHMGRTLHPDLTIEAEHSVALQDTSSPQKHPR